MENEILQQILETQKLMFSEIKDLKRGQDETNKRLDGVEIDIKGVKQKVTKIEITLENETNKNIRLLCEGHSDIVEKFDGLPEKIIALQDGAQVHNIAIKELFRKSAK